MILTVFDWFTMNVEKPYRGITKNIWHRQLLLHRKWYRIRYRLISENKSLTLSMSHLFMIFDSILRYLIPPYRTLDFFFILCPLFFQSVPPSACFGVLDLNETTPSFNPQVILKFVTLVLALWQMCVQCYVPSARFYMSMCH